MSQFRTDERPGRRQTSLAAMTRTAASCPAVADRAWTLAFEAPQDGAFERIARMAAAGFGTPIATVSIVDPDRVWFAASEGLDGVQQVGTEPGLCVSAVMEPGPYVVNDAEVDPRTLDHPLVRGEFGLRFYAAAPIELADGRVLGTVNVIDRKRRRRVTDAQLTLLSDLAAIVADLMQMKLSSLAQLRLERANHAAETAQRDAADRMAAEAGAAGRAPRDRERPGTCQLGEGQRCARPAELKVADSWGDSAWGCWTHAETALINVPSVFLAMESPAGLDSYRRRLNTAADPHPSAAG